MERDGTDRAGWYSDDQATLGDRLTAARETAGMSRADLARRLGVRQATLAGWEDDRAEPRANRMHMLAGMLGVSMRWLMTGEGEGPDSENALGPDLRAMLGEMRGLAAEQARLAGRLARLEKRMRRAMEQA